MVSTVRANGATTIFAEPLASPRLARDGGARNRERRSHVLDPIEGLTPREVDRGADYFTVMRANLTALRTGARMSLAVELAGSPSGTTRGVPVLENVDLEIAEGQFVAIAGPNGGGKTTLRG